MLADCAPEEHHRALQTVPEPADLREVAAFQSDADFREQILHFLEEVVDHFPRNLPAVEAPLDRLVEHSPQAEEAA